MSVLLFVVGDAEDLDAQDSGGLGETRVDELEEKVGLEDQDIGEILFGAEVHESAGNEEDEDRNEEEVGSSVEDIVGGLDHRAELDQNHVSGPHEHEDVEDVDINPVVNAFRA